jgi:hypothetical protein
LIALLRAERRPYNRRLVSGLMRIAQLAFGILIAAQVAGIAESNLVVTQVNRLGAWAPWAGIVVYGVGGFLCFGPPSRFFPWMMAMLFTAYAGQLAGNALFGTDSATVSPLPSS